MKRKNGLLFPLILLLMVPTTAYAQLWTGIIDPSRAIDWSKAGIPGGIPNRTTICSTINAATYGNGTSDATGGIQTALNGCPSGQVVSLSAGTFLIRPASRSLVQAGSLSAVTCSLRNSTTPPSLASPAAKGAAPGATAEWAGTAHGC